MTDSPPLIWVARLTPDRVLVGFDKVSTAPEGAVIVPANCDLACDGRYRWNDNLRRFDPIPAAVLAMGDTAAHNAMVLGVLAGYVPEANVPVEVSDTVAFIRATGPKTEDELNKLVTESAAALLKRGQRNARVVRDLARSA